MKLIILIVSLALILPSYGMVISDKLDESNDSQSDQADNALLTLGDDEFGVENSSEDGGKNKPRIARHQQIVPYYYEMVHDPSARSSLLERLQDRKKGHKHGHQQHEPAPQYPAHQAELVPLYLHAAVPHHHQPAPHPVQPPSHHKDGLFKCPHFNPHDLLASLPALLSLKKLLMHGVASCKHEEAHGHYGGHHRSIDGAPLMAEPFQQYRYGESSLAMDPYSPYIAYAYNPDYRGLNNGENLSNVNPYISSPMLNTDYQSAPSSQTQV